MTTLIHDAVKTLDQFIEKSQEMDRATGDWTTTPLKDFDYRQLDKNSLERDIKRYNKEIKELGQKLRESYTDEQKEIVANLLQAKREMPTMGEDVYLELRRIFNTSIRSNPEQYGIAKNIDRMCKALNDTRQQLDLCTKQVRVREALKVDYPTEWSREYAEAVSAVIDGAISTMLFAQPTPPYDTTQTAFIDRHDDEPAYTFKVIGDPLVWDLPQIRMILQETIKSQLADAQHWKPVNTKRGKGVCIQVPNAEGHAKGNTLTFAVVSALRNADPEKGPYAKDIALSYLYEGVPMTRNELVVAHHHHQSSHPDEPFCYEHRIILTGKAKEEILPLLGFSKEKIGEIERAGGRNR